MAYKAGNEPRVGDELRAGDEARASDAISATASGTLSALVSSIAAPGAGTSGLCSRVRSRSSRRRCSSSVASSPAPVC